MRILYQCYLDGPQYFHCRPVRGLDTYELGIPLDPNEDLHLKKLPKDRFNEMFSECS